MSKYYMSIMLLLLVGCIPSPESTQKNPEESSMHKLVICLDGVRYWYAGNQLAPMFNKDSKVVLCEESK